MGDDCLGEDADSQLVTAALVVFDDDVVAAQEDVTATIARAGVEYCAPRRAAAVNADAMMSPIRCQ